MNDELQQPPLTLSYDMELASRSMHDDLCKLAKTGGAYTRDFSSHMFSGEASYEKGWIRVAKGTYGLHALPEGLAVPPLLGLTCVRHKVRTPVTELYFITVDPIVRGTFVASNLIHDLMGNSPHNIIGLNCMKDNERGLGFYKREGFKIVGEAIKGQAHRLERHFTEEDWKT